MGEWIEYVLEDLGKIVTGKTPPSQIQDAYGGKVPFITPKDMDGRKFIEKTERFLSISGIEAVKNSLIPEKSIAVSCIGSDLGKAVMTVANSVTNQQINSIVVNNEVFDPEFIYYNMSIRQEELKSIASGSATPIINKGHFSKLKMVIPDLTTQKSISSILSSLDDKIELNRKMNETLEEMARAIFKSWFVDFDPVHAKARGEKPAGMPDEIADLFPAEFVHSDQLDKLIPKGWEVKPLGEIFNLTMGQSPPGNTYNREGEGVPFYQGRTDFGFRFPTKRIYCNAPKRMAEQFDILVSVRAPVGDVNVANEVCCIGRGIAALKHKSGSFSYSYYSMKNLESVFNSYESGGTVFGSINQKEFNTLKLLEPSPELVRAFERCISCIDEKILNNSQQIIVLQEERDSLLPKLISGEIEV